MQYLDSSNLPGTRQSDGSLDMGDSAAIYFNAKALSDPNLGNQWNLYFDQVPLRHPDKTKWWGQPDRFSRDQLTPLLCWAALQDKGNDPLVIATFRAHLKHTLLFAWNTKGNGAIDMPNKTPDITFLEIWGLWLRVFKPFGYKLLLPICDLESLVNSIIWKFRTDQICRNQMLVAITQRDVSPSITSRVSYWINNWSDLVQRWKDHCAATGEYPTGDLFAKELLK